MSLVGEAIVLPDIKRHIQRCHIFNGAMFILPRGGGRGERMDGGGGETYRWPTIFIRVLRLRYIFYLHVGGIIAEQPLGVPRCVPG